MKTFKNTIYLLLIFIFTFLSSCKNTAQEEKQVKKIEYINKDDSSLVKTEFYDKKGNNTKLINHSVEYGDSEKTFLFDYDNNLIEEKEFNTKGELVKTKFYEYKSLSDQEFLELTYEKRKGSEKKLISEDKLEYNDEGKLFRKSHRTVYGNWTYDYKYHSNNKLKEETILAFKETEKVVVTYNEKGEKETEKIYRRKTKDDVFELKQTNKVEIAKSKNKYTKKYTYHN